VLSKCQGMGRRTRVAIKSMEEKAAYIPGGQAVVSVTEGALEGDDQGCT
jgi:hypothetical protein